MFLFLSIRTSEQAWAEMLRMCNTATFESVFRLGKRLGAGAGGTVYLGTHLGSGEMSAIKNIDLGGGGTKKVKFFANISPQAF